MSVTKEQVYVRLRERMADPHDHPTDDDVIAVTLELAAEAVGCYVDALPALVAAVMPEVPRYSLDQGWGGEPYMIQDPTGEYVTRFDHLTAMRQQRDTALREAVEYVPCTCLVTGDQSHLGWCAYRRVSERIRRLIAGEGTPTTTN